jgi:hypothetical protein
MDNFNLFCFSHPYYNAECSKSVSSPTLTCKTCCRIFVSYQRRKMEKEKVNVATTN